MLYEVITANLNIINVLTGLRGFLELFLPKVLMLKIPNIKKKDGITGYHPKT